MSLASLWAWPSCSVRRAFATIVNRKVVKCGWSTNFGELLLQVDSKLVCAEVEKVQVHYYTSYGYLVVF